MSDKEETQAQPVTVTIYTYDPDLIFLNQRDQKFKSQELADKYDLQDGESYLPFIAVYRANNENIYIGSVLVRNDYKLGANELLTGPEPGLYEPITLANGGWQGTDEAEYQKAVDAEAEARKAAHPELYEPSAEQQIIMQQASDINNLKQITMSQASQIASLTKGSAE